MLRPLFKLVKTQRGEALIFEEGDGYYHITREIVGTKDCCWDTNPQYAKTILKSDVIEEIENFEFVIQKGYVVIPIKSADEIDFTFKQDEIIFSYNVSEKRKNKIMNLLQDRFPELFF